MFRLRSQYMEAMNCTSTTIDEEDYQAMLAWFDKNDMQPGINPQSSDMVNYKLVQQWIEYNSTPEQ